MTDTYWALLIEQKPSLAEGDTIPNIDSHGHPVPVIKGDPRSFWISDILLERNRSDYLQHFIWDDTVVLARVSPLGAVRPDGDVQPGWTLEADQGWKIQSFEPTNRILGTWGQRAEQVFKEMLAAWRSEDSTIRDRYEAARGSKLDQFRHAKAAEKALAALGGEKYFWSACVGQDQFGHEIAALAARDLIGRYDGWTLEAYEGIAAPYQAAFGEALHPDDDVKVPTATSMVAG
jgi:hypothetical protein